MVESLVFKFCDRSVDPNEMVMLRGLNKQVPHHVEFFALFRKVYMHNLL